MVYQAMVETMRDLSLNLLNSWAATLISLTVPTTRDFALDNKLTATWVVAVIIIITTIIDHSTWWNKSTLHLQLLVILLTRLTLTNNQFTSNNNRLPLQITKPQMLHSNSLTTGAVLISQINSNKVPIKLWPRKLFYKVCSPVKAYML